MALSGIHVACGYVGGAGQGSHVQALTQPPIWSQTMASPGVTGIGATDGKGVAPNFDSSSGSPSFEVCAVQDVYVAVGPTPDATSGARTFVKGDGYPRNIFCRSGDKLAWVAA